MRGASGVRRARGGGAPTTTRVIGRLPRRRLLLVAAGSILAARDARASSSAFAPPVPAIRAARPSRGTARPRAPRADGGGMRDGVARSRVPGMPPPPARGSAAPEAPSSSSLSSTSSSSSSSFHAEPGGGTLVVMDVENIRGAAGFRVGHEALLSRIRRWREDRLLSSSTGGGGAPLEPLVWACDHGTSPSAHHFGLQGNEESDVDGEVRMPHNFGAIFAGPGRTADDVIVDLVEQRCGLCESNGQSNDAVDGDDSPIVENRDNPSPATARNSTIVITADARLISRCQQVRRRGRASSDVVFVEPASLLQQLERYRTNARVEESFFGEAPVRVTTPSPSLVRGKISQGKREDGKTNKLTSFKDSTIAMAQHAKFQARFQNNGKGSLANPSESDGKEIDVKDEVEEDGEEGETDANAVGSNSDAALAAQLKTEQIRRQLLLSDAYYLARPSRNARGPSAATRAKYKNRNISKKQQKKLYQKRFGRKRKDDMVRAAATRKELAQGLQRNLERVGDGEHWDECVVDYEGCVEEGDHTIPSMRLLKTLLGKFEEDRLRRSSSMGAAPAATPSDPTALLGLGATAAGRVGASNKWDPLGSTLHVPLFGNSAGEGDEEEGGMPPPLRIVVISDTHGFEGGIAKFADPSEEKSPSDDDGAFEDINHLSETIQQRADDFLLPRADLLLHCGDFAASGSRKTQRLAARRLDEFLARQTHIPEKIVIKGNHDPESPAKVLFPHSKALYVKRPSTLTVNGVSFAIEPYLRRTSFSGVQRKTASSPYAAPILPACDVLVSHEPPKGVLDLTYHGFSAGSLHLRKMVERAEVKPRLWLCGHIHEGRGVMSRRFHRSEFVGGGNENCDEDDCEETMVINASNANSGRANRIVSGAVVVEVDRRPSPTSTGGDNGQTAESTLQTRTVTYLDGFLDNGLANDSADGIAELGEDLELCVTRPGVRRRKGVPQSMRQRMKQARSTLAASS